ncbi:MAG: PIG-L deacetylase family protein [Terriglobales bacterium]
MAVNILAVDAHAADMEMTCGGALALAVKEGGAVTLLHLTLGEKGSPTLTPAEYAVQKKREALLAAQRLGAAVRFLDYPDAEIPYNEAAALKIAAVIRATRPDIVITQWGGSSERDDRNTHYLVNDAVFYAALPAMTQVPGQAHEVRQVYYTDSWEDPLHYQPDTFVDIGSVYDTWLHAASAYQIWRGGIEDFPFAAYYEALTVTRGAVAGFRHAQAFKAAEHQLNLRSWREAK